MRKSITGTATDDVSKVGMRLALEPCEASGAQTKRFASGSVLATLAVVLAKVVALVHTQELDQVVGWHRSETRLALAAVRVVGRLEQADTVRRADGLIGGIAARIGALDLECGTRHFRRGIRRARDAARLLAVRLVRADWADDASVLFRQERSRLTLGLGAVFDVGRSWPSGREPGRARLARHLAALGAVSALGARLAGGVVRLRRQLLASGTLLGAFRR